MVDAPTFIDPLLDPRAVRDEYKGLPTADIKKLSLSNSLPFSLLMENDVKDISRGGLVRNANAFGARRVITYGQKRRYDRRSAVCAHVYLDFEHAKNIEELKTLISPDARIIAVELTNTSISLYDYSFDFTTETILMLGHESSDGLAQELRDFAHDSVYIPMKGTVRSLNVVSACAAVLSEYSRQYCMTERGRTK